MNLKTIFLIIFFAFCLYICSYFFKRTVKVSTKTVTVNYEGYGFRQYILDIPNFDEKLESGTFDVGGKRSYLIRFYRPVEALEMKLRFKVVYR